MARRARKRTLTGGGAVELVRIIAAVVGSVADTPQGDARETVLAAESPFLALGDI